MHSSLDVFRDNRCQVPSNGSAPSPQPGEIWRIHRNLSESVPKDCPIDPDLFSEPALRFLDGHGPHRYVMIVGNVRPLFHYALVLAGQIASRPSKSDRSASLKLDSPAHDLGSQPWVTAMVLGNSLNGYPLKKSSRNGTLTPFSRGDILLPTPLSGLNHPVIAETWHIVPVLLTQLYRAEGHRLSSTLYNHLMDIGDTLINPSIAPAHIANTPTPLSDLGIQETCGPLSRSQIQAFHHNEQQWSEVLRLPITVCQMQLERLNTASSMINRAMWLERSSIE